LKSNFIVTAEKFEELTINSKFGGAPYNGYPGGGDATSGQLPLILVRLHPVWPFWVSGTVLVTFPPKPAVAVDTRLDLKVGVNDDEKSQKAISRLGVHAGGIGASFRVRLASALSPVSTEPTKRLPEALL
jgi:hypothetical protein